MNKYLKNLVVLVGAVLMLCTPAQAVSSENTTISRYKVSNKPIILPNSQYGVKTAEALPGEVAPINVNVTTSGYDIIVDWNWDEQPTAAYGFGVYVEARTRDYTPTGEQAGSYVLSVCYAGIARLKTGRDSYVCHVWPGAVYKVGFNLCYYHASDDTYSCPFAQPKEAVINAEVSYSNSVIGKITKLGDSATLKYYSWPKYLASQTNGYSIPVRTHTTYDPLKNEYPKNGYVNTSIILIRPDGTTKVTTTKSPWYIFQQNSGASYWFKPTEKGTYIIRTTLHLDRGFVYKYTVPGHYEYQIEKRNTRTRADTRPQRVAVWIPERTMTTDYIRWSNVFVAN